MIGIISIGLRFLSSDHGKWPDCHRIKCQTGPGWTGEFAPDCKYTPVSVTPFILL